MSRSASLRAALAAALVPALPAAAARAETLAASLSTSRVAITSNYTGASIVVFGGIEKDAQTIARAGSYDIVVMVRGPRAAIVVREKGPMGPIWLNRAQRRLADVPLYLAALSSRPIEQVTTEPLRARLKAGLRAVAHAPEAAAPGGDGAEPGFREALLRLQKQDRLWVENPRGVTFLTANLFRAPVPIPAIAPPGNYDVDVMLFSDSVLLARSQTNFELVKIGFEQQVAAAAREWSLLYGLVVGALALTFGWLASVIFRRD